MNYSCISEDATESDGRLERIARMTKRRRDEKELGSDAKGLSATVR
jgi:hypothetical protein